MIKKKTAAPAKRRTGAGKTPAVQGHLSILYGLGSLLAVATALPAYLQSNFIGQFVDVSLVSAFFIIANAATLIAILVFPSLIRKLSNYYLTKVVMALYVCALLSLTISRTPLAALLAITVFTITSALIWINMDLLVESFTKNESTGRTRTVYFTFMNGGWILSPALASYLISQGSYNLAFLTAALLVIPIFLIFSAQKKKFNDRIHYPQTRIIPTWQKVWRQKNHRGIFIVAFLLQLFYSSAVIYIPLHLVQNLGMTWETLGPIFSLMLVPFLLLQIPAGILADRYWGEKEMMAGGLAIIAICLFFFYYIETGTAWVWAVVLFASRCGAAIVEAMRETYFFKIVDAKDIGYINFFRATGPLAYIVGASLALVLLAFLPLNYFFLIISLLVASGLIFVAGIQDTK